MLPLVINTLCHFSFSVTYSDKNSKTTEGLLSINIDEFHIHAIFYCTVVFSRQQKRKKKIKMYSTFLVTKGRQQQGPLGIIWYKRKLYYVYTYVYSSNKIMMSYSTKICFSIKLLPHTVHAQHVYKMLYRQCI